MTNPDEIVTPDLHEFRTEELTMNRIRREIDADRAARAAAETAAEVILAAASARGTARVIFASAPSQERMLDHLTSDPRLDWGMVRAFHMDEYLGLDMDRPQAFGQWLTDRLPSSARFERIRTDGDPDSEVSRYSALISEAPIDVTCLGVGVNGHIAFNEPGDTDLADIRVMRQVQLEETSRRQQVDDGLFPSLDDVPTSALTLTVPALVSARSMVCTVLGVSKSEAVARALTGEVSGQCPASILTTHPDAVWAVDKGAASLLPEHLDAAASDA